MNEGLDGVQIRSCTKMIINQLIYFMKKDRNADADERLHFLLLLFWTKLFWKDA